jgi:uncharacterized protein (TIGR02147 family)
MKPIFEYGDYRTYLREYYEEKKGQSKSYSFRFFAKRAGLNSPNYYKLVMDGERNLTHRNVRKFAKGLNLGERETLFFENLVFYTQAKDPEEKAFFQGNLDLARSQDDRVLLTRDQHQVLANWYPLAIKELVLLGGFKLQPKWIAGRFDHRFTPEEAKAALELLERVGLVEIDRKAGRVRVTHQSMQTPDITRSAAAAIFHKKMLDLAKEAVDKQSSEERCFSSVTVAVRKNDLKKAFKRIHQFRNEMDTYFGNGTYYDAVYQLNLQLFRLDNDD